MSTVPNNPPTPADQPSEQDVAFMKKSLQRIEGLLQRQLEAARAGNLTGVRNLTPLIDTAVHAAGALENLDHPEYRSTLLSLQRLRTELNLVLESQRAEVGEKLDQMRRGGQSLKAYRGLSTR